MRVKVLLLPETVDKPGKVEYFNDISYWQTDGTVLHLYKRSTDESSGLTATILNWTWIKEDSD